jgi:hypothetical protein
MQITPVMMNGREARFSDSLRGFWLSVSMGLTVIVAEKQSRDDGALHGDRGDLKAEIGDAVQSKRNQ